MVVDAGRRQPGPQTKAVRPCCRLVATAARKPCAIAAPGQSAATVAGGIGLTGPMRAAHRKPNAETAEYRRGQIQTGPNTDGAENRQGRNAGAPDSRIKCLSLSSNPAVIHGPDGAVD